MLVYWYTIYQFSSRHKYRIKWVVSPIISPFYPYDTPMFGWNQHDKATERIALSEHMVPQKSADLSWVCLWKWPHLPFSDKHSFPVGWLIYHTLCVCVILMCTYKLYIYIPRMSHDIPIFVDSPFLEIHHLAQRALAIEVQHWLQTGASAGHRFQPFHLAVQVIEGRHGGGRFLGTQRDAKMDVFGTENWSQRKWHTRCCKQYSRDSRALLVTITKLGGERLFLVGVRRY